MVGAGPSPVFMGVVIVQGHVDALQGWGRHIRAVADCGLVPPREGSSLPGTP